MNRVNIEEESKSFRSIYIDIVPKTSHPLIKNSKSFRKCILRGNQLEIWISA